MNNDVTKLPKWAQDEIARLRGNVRYHQNKAEQLRGDFENRGSWDVLLGGLDTLHIRKDGDALDIFGGTTIQVEPQSGNHIKIRIRRFDP